MNHNHFYVYVYCDPRKPGKFSYERDGEKLEEVFDFEPFYVGAGHDSRIAKHMKDAKSYKSGSNKRLDKISKIISIGGTPIIFKLIDNLSYEEAFNFWERYYIRVIGRNDLNLGPLTNLTDGGTGGSTTKNTVWVNNGDKSIMVKKEMLIRYIEAGWTKGRLKSDMSASFNKGKILINNSIEQIYIEKFELEYYRSLGFHMHAIKGKRAQVKKILCSYCNKEIDPGNFSKSHGEKCKFSSKLENKRFSYVKVTCRNCGKSIGRNSIKKHLITCEGVYHYSLEVLNDISNKINKIVLNYNHIYVLPGNQISLTEFNNKIEGLKNEIEKYKNILNLEK